LCPQPTYNKHICRKGNKQQYIADVSEIIIHSFTYKTDLIFYLCTGVSRTNYIVVPSVCLTEKDTRQKNKESSKKYSSAKLQLEKKNCNTTAILKDATRGRVSQHVGHAHLVGVVHEVHGDAEGQRVVVRVPQQDGHDLHARRLGLALPVVQRALQRPLAVHGVLAHLAPAGGGRVTHSVVIFSPHPCAMQSCGGGEVMMMLG